MTTPKRKFEGITADEARKMRDEGEHVSRMIAHIEDLIGTKPSPVQISLTNFSEKAGKNIEAEFKKRGFDASLIDCNHGDDYKAPEWLLTVTW